MNPPLARLTRWGLRGLQLGLIALLLYFVIRPLVTHGRELSRLTWKPELHLLVLGSVLLLITYGFLALIWTRMVVALNGPLGFLEGARMWFLSNLGRYLPGKVWPVAGLIYMARRQGIPALAVSYAIILSQVLSLLTGLVLVFLLLPQTLSGEVKAYLPYSYLLAGLGLPLLYPPWMERLINLALRLVGRPPIRLSTRLWRVVEWFFLYLGAWGLHSLAFVLFAQAFPPLQGISVLSLTAIFILSYIVGFLAVFAPAGIGVREGTLTFLLSAFLPLPAASLLALSSRLWFMVIELLPIGYFLMKGGWVLLTGWGSPRSEEPP